MGEPVDEILVVDNSGHGIARRVLEGQAGRVRIVDAEGNVGIAGRNLAAGMAAGDLLLMLDQDSYPLPGAVDAMIDIFGAKPRTGVVGGMVLDIDSLGVALSTGREPGSFDWFLRPRAVGHDGVSDSPAFFFPEGASMIRREAYLGIGGSPSPTSSRSKDWNSRRGCWLPAGTCVTCHKPVFTMFGTFEREPRTPGPSGIASATSSGTTHSGSPRGWR